MKKAGGGKFTVISPAFELLFGVQSCCYPVN
jgi:hypothetical protein